MLATALRVPEDSQIRDPKPRGVAAPKAPARAAPAPSATGIGVTIRDLRKDFDGHTVIEGLDLHIPAGQFVAVVGRSDCGKSTLLRLILGLEQPSAGRIALESQGPRTPPKRIMFQEPRLLPWKSVLDNVALGLPRSVGAAAASLWTVGLAERADDWPSALSGGQKQRVALARALVHEPQLLLLDEPLGALDALTRIEMQQLIESLWLARGFTAVLVTHDVAEAVALADRVLLIEDGRITLDMQVDLPRPRQRGHAAFAALEQAILSRVLQPQGQIAAPAR